LHKRSEIKIIILGHLLFVLVSCSPTKSNKVLSFFFDGVPVSDSVNVAAISELSQDSSRNDLFLAKPFTAVAGYNLHYPYQEKDCFSCHDEKSKSELLLPQPALCYTCHDDFSKKYKIVHGPVSSGYCTTCHNAHMSKEKSLLIRTGQQVCLFCHDSGPLLRSETHKDIADTDCTLCHNPHGGDNRFLLN
jgi:predicted CXXCH cytochrome family protein